ncbi:hypothetical protein [Shewanella algae]
MGRNWDYSKAQGRDKRLEAELQAHRSGSAVPTHAPFFSHDGTMQSFFNAGWHGVSACDIRIHIDQSIVPQGTDTLSKLRSIRQCHSL